MHTRSTILAALMAAAIALPLSGCGENDNNINLNDNGGQPTRTPTPGRTATAVPTPVATVTAVPSDQPTSTAVAATPTTNVAATATATTGAPAPTATSTPTGGGATCASGEHVMLDASLDQAFAAFAITVAYPPSSVNIPQSGPDPAVKQRVAFNVTGALTTASDDDDIGGDGVDDTLHVSVVTNVDNPAGKVFTVTFDCIAGQPVPAAGAFTCTVVSASNSAPDTINPNCTLQVR